MYILMKEIYCYKLIQRFRVTGLFAGLYHRFNLIFVFHSHVMRGIPQPSRGKVGKNRSTQSKTTVRSKGWVP